MKKQYQIEAQRAIRQPTYPRFRVIPVQFKIPDFIRICPLAALLIMFGLGAKFSPPFCVIVDFNQ